MELLCNSFKNAVQDIFNKSSRPILATIPIAKIPFVESLRNNPDCNIIEVCFKLKLISLNMHCCISGE